ncbi:formyltransferase family protein [Pseudoalteromonas sp. OOF1S-7]|uniref:methionyl-tRNA formyltransferase n=1 Tax=Pseudoalteromonas sp. OOF1S-7 TaxID=2917757 RepID=UPI001EF7344D|nr:formyltransferase family protein [Pseudoalteromonas sp. OOF1S-7]MCG7534316.1 hypothetical protein [Pseudoalteromonas sp. OOF1S-7]
MSARYAVFSGSCLTLGAIQYLHQANLLACVVLPDAEPNPDLVRLEEFLRHQQVKVLKYQHESDDELLASLDRLGINGGLVHLFRHKIRQRLIQFFAGNLYNVHPGALPDYRGPMPLFWQLRNGESEVCLTLHRVTSDLDCGEIGAELEVPIHPFDTHQCLHQKTAQAIPELLSQFFSLQQGGELQWREQVLVKDGGASEEPRQFARQVRQEDLLVDWQRHSSAEIINLARAANADLGGARFVLREAAYQLLQATRVEQDMAGIRPGTVVSLGRRDGLVVKTRDGALRLDVVVAPQGIFDGYKFAVLFGLDPGLSL